MGRLRLSEGWTTFALLAGVVMSVTWAIQRADWAAELALLTPITLWGLALGLALAKWRRLPAFVAHPLALLLGGILLVDRLDPLLPLPPDGHGWRPAAGFLLKRAATWFARVEGAQYAEDFYLFLLGLGAIVWIIAYSSTWMVFRSGWIWPALLLPTVVILFSLGYVTGRDISSSLVLFLICALLLVARFQMAQREAEWRRQGTAYPDSLAWRALSIGMVVATLTVGFAWLAPFTARGAPLQSAWARVSGPWLRLEQEFTQRFGASLRGPGGRGVGNFATFGERFRLGGPLKLSQNPVLTLAADRPYYLKARTYDTFDGHQWETKAPSTFNGQGNGLQFAPRISLPGGQDLAVQPAVATERRELTVKMQSSRGPGGLFTADQFVNTSRDSLVQLSWTQVENRPFDLTDNARFEEFPPDLRNIANLLYRAGQAGNLRNTDEQGRPLPVPQPAPPVVRRGAADATATVAPTPVLVVPPPSAAEREIQQEQNGLNGRLIQVRWIVRDGVAARMLVSGQLPNYGDVEVVLLPGEGGLAAGAEYKTTILASTALAPQLREAGNGYPEWVTQRYLQQPATMSPRVREHAARLAAGQNPYDAAVTIQNWLRENIKYNENIPYPPADRDVVDYLLFDSKQGYCEYYATAMAVMLRSLGIPTRSATGFFSGEFDEGAGAFLYRESNAHAWVEVYFPTYGWVAFEPTSPRPAFDREPAPPPGESGGAPEGGDGSGDGAGGDLPFDDEYADGLGIGGGVTPPREAHLVVRVLRVALPVAAILALALAALWLVSLRGLTPGGQFYARATRSGRLAGVRPAPGATPYEWSRALGTAVPEAQRSLQQIADLYVRERYGGRRPTPQDLRLVQRAWLTFRRALLRSLLSFRRHLGRARGGA